MKFFIYVASSLLIIIGAILIAFSVASRKQPELGLHNGQLRPCPQTPNCVCSEQQDESAYIAPLSYSATAEQAWARIKRVISVTGGSLITEDTDYLRVGKSDLGANRKRIEKIRIAFNKLGTE